MADPSHYIPFSGSIKNCPSLPPSPTPSYSTECDVLPMDMDDSYEVACPGSTRGRRTRREEPDTTIKKLKPRGRSFSCGRNNDSELLKMDPPKTVAPLLDGPSLKTVQDHHVEKSSQPAREEAQPHEKSQSNAITSNKNTHTVPNNNNSATEQIAVNNKNVQTFTFDNNINTPVRPVNEYSSSFQNFNSQLVANNDVSHNYQSNSSQDDKFVYEPVLVDGIYIAILQPVDRAIFFAKLNPLKIKRDLRALGSDVHISHLRFGGLVVRTKCIETAKRVLQTRSIANVAVRAKTPRSERETKGVISGVYTELTDSEIIDDINSGDNPASVKAIACVKLGGPKSTARAVTFAGKVLPDKIYVGLAIHRLKSFYENPTQCFRCQRYGHQASNCKGKQKCLYCGKPDHDHKHCDSKAKKLTPVCCNCMGSHAAWSSKCEAKKVQIEICKVRATDKISFSAARAIIMPTKMSFSEALRRCRERRKRIQNKSVTNISHSPIITTQAPSLDIHAEWPSLHRLRENTVERSVAELSGTHPSTPRQKVNNPVTGAERSLGLARDVNKPVTAEKCTPAPREESSQANANAVVNQTQGKSYASVVNTPAVQVGNKVTPDNFCKLVTLISNLCISEMTTEDTVDQLVRAAHFFGVTLPAEKARGVIIQYEDELMDE